MWIIHELTGFCWGIIIIIKRLYFTIGKTQLINVVFWNSSRQYTHLINQSLLLRSSILAWNLLIRSELRIYQYHHLPNNCQILETPFKTTASSCCIHIKCKNYSCGKLCKCLFSSFLTSRIEINSSWNFQNPENLLMPRIYLSFSKYWYFSDLF